MLCLSRKGTDNEMDHTTEHGTSRKKRNNVMTGKWFELEMFSSASGTVDDWNGIYGIPSRSFGLNLPENGFIFLCPSEKNVMSCRQSTG